MTISLKSPYVLAGLFCLILSGVGATQDAFLPSHSQPPPLPQTETATGFGTNQLIGNLGTTDSAAGWRLKGETVWHASGDPADNLLPGTYWLEFKPVTGKSIPELTSWEVTDTNSSFTTSYINSDEPLGEGWLRVDSPSEPAPVAGFWRIVGETQWRTSGKRSGSLPCGVVTVEFKPVASYLTPDPEFVRILPDQGICLEISYSAATSGIWAMAPISPTEATDAPFRYVGLVHSSRGTFTGTAVGQYTVLTTLDAVYDPETGSFAKGITWTPASHAGTRRPPPRKSAGFIMMADYNDPVELKKESKRLVAIYFTRSAADGGWSGYHVGSEWLTGRDGRIIGYSGERGPASQRGIIHSSALQPLATQPFPTPIFTLPGLLPTPGLGGATLFTRRSGRDYPAAIFIGRGAEATFRIIDQDVADLITTAEDKALLDNGGTGPNGATQGTGDYGSGTVAKGYVRASINGAATEGSNSAKWELASITGDSIETNIPSGKKVETEATSQMIRLTSLSGVSTPEDRSVRVTSNRIAEIDFTYTQTYEGWSLITFTDSQRAAGNTGQREDFDRDGIVNLLEWAFGLNPLVADSHSTATDSLPGIPLVNPMTPGGMTVQYLRRKSAVSAGVTYEAGFTSSLDTWQSGMELDPVDIDSEWEQVTVEDAGPVTEGRRYARVAVTPPSP